MLRLLLCKLELRSWHAFYNCSGCPLEKVNHQKRGGISDFREQCFAFSSARDVPFWRSNLQQRADGHASPSGWENLYPNKLHDHPRGMAACKMARSSSCPASSLLCLRKASKASDATTSSCPRPWWYVGTPCSALLSYGVSAPVPHGGQICGEVF